MTRTLRAFLLAVLLASSGGAAAQSPPPPSCEIYGPVSAVMLGSSVTFYTFCYGTVTSYVWTGCTSTSDSCTTTAANVGLVTYSVVATGPYGNSAPVSITVNWVVPRPLIRCTLTPERQLAAVGSTVTLTATCAPGPVAGYHWEGCDSTGPVCIATSSRPDFVHYSVSATDGLFWGPQDVTHVEWVQQTPVCTVTPSSVSPAVGQALTLTAACSGNPVAFRWNACAGQTNTCVVTASSPGFVIYDVAAENSSGTGPTAGVATTWRPAGSMACEGSQSASTAQVGQNVSLSVGCTPAALAYAWTQCESAGQGCAATATTPGTRVYSVTAQGSGNTTVVTNFVVDWRPATPQVPTCTLVPSTVAPVVGGMLTLKAVCGNEPDAYFWSGCLSNTDTCQTTNISADLVRYSLFAANKVGFGNVASVSIKWLQAPGQGLRAIEYYHAGLDHHFMTASLDETSKLDAGVIAGWTRTGESLAVVPPGLSQLPDLTPVCRFYGNPAAGLDSHFYSASPAECAKVQANFPAWLLESTDVFQVYQLETATGLCPAATLPVYRLFNQRSDANHRYTTSAAIFAEMLARGYVAEGSGSPPVVFCAAGP